MYLKFENIEELTAQYYPRGDALEEYALRELVRICGYGNDITNILLRGNICSIKDLHNASTDRLEKLRNVGPKKLAAILEVKEFINSMVEEG